jgi:hypothetical protein
MSLNVILKQWETGWKIQYCLTMAILINVESVIEVHGNIQAGVTDLQVGVNNVVVKDGLTFAGYPGASTDIVCIYEMRAVLRSQQ